MEAVTDPFVVPLILVGALIVVDLLLQAVARRLGVPGVVVHLLLGMVVAVSEWRWGWPHEPGRSAIELLGSVGVVFLLFRVGLESNVEKLAENLRGATVVWLADVVVSGSLGFVVSRYLIGLELVPSLFVATAMTVTSVGVSVAVWREEGALESKRGQLLLDVAELDDVSGIVLMAVLFAVAPLLRTGEAEGLGATVGLTMVEVLGRLVLFALLIAAFSRYAEEPLARFVARLETPPDRLVTIVGLGLVVAAIAGALGFSLAIGAFFAGLAFSRDPEAVKLDVYFDPLYDFFTPFFFIAIGARIAPESFGAALPLGLALCLVAAVGKVLGAGGGSLGALSSRDALVLGLSMVPRAEIAMVIVQAGLLLGAWAVPPEVFSAMVVVSALSCLLAPMAIRPLLR